MKKKVSKKKRSTRAQHEQNALARNTWKINPVTRMPPNSRAYIRAKQNAWKTENYD